MVTKRATSPIANPSWGVSATAGSGDWHWVTAATEIYTDGYKRAKSVDRPLADSYIRHTQVGDPLADAAIADLGKLPEKEVAWLVGGAIEQNDRVLRHAPESLQRLVHDMSVIPTWYDKVAAQHGCRAFFRNSDQILAAFVAGSIVEGFSTMISKPFAITGRLVHDGVRRLKQNVRHLLDIFMPRCVEPPGDGWKLTLRIRIVHARIRCLFADAEEWEHEAWGVPVSAAHLALAATCFSARLLEFAAMLGAALDDDDRAGVMQIWSYTAHVMGVPEELLFHSHAEGLHLFRLGAACEPAPDSDAITMAHCIINSAPTVVGVRKPAAQAAAARHLYRVSRELIGHSAADQLRFPARHAFPVLPRLRTKLAVRRHVGTVFPAIAKARTTASFLHILTLADLGEYGITYDLPDHVHSDRSSRW